MKKRIFGNTGFEISEVGLGCWQLGADWGQDISKDKAFDILQTAVDQGVTFFDTADVYGQGKSEQLIGDFLKETKYPVKVATKFGRDADVYPDKYSEDLLRSSIDGSIKRLGVDSLDLIQLHCIPTEVLKRGNVFDWLRRAKEDGLIKAFGASVETVEEGIVCIEQPGISSLQVIFNVFRQKLVQELLPQAQNANVGIIVRLPLASGLLSGKFKQETRFSEHDHRNFNQNGELFNVGETFAGLPFKKGVELTEIIREEFLPKDLSMVQFALRWILDHEAVTTIIPGASSPDQVKSNASVSELQKLPTELHDSIREFYQQEVYQHIRGAY